MIWYGTRNDADLILDDAHFNDIVNPRGVAEVARCTGMWGPGTNTGMWGPGTTTNTQRDH
jgi:hypothetical protein